MNSLDPSTITKFCEHPNDYFLRVCQGETKETYVVRAESRKSLWTWIKLLFFDRKSYRFAQVMNALEKVPKKSFSEDFLQTLGQRIRKYSQRHPDDQAIMALFEKIMLTATPGQPPGAEPTPETAKAAPTHPLASPKPTVPESAQPVAHPEPPDLVPTQTAQTEPQRQAQPRRFHEMIGVSPLTEEQFQATLGSGHLYSQNFRENIYRFHTHGHLWSQEEHENLFAQGLLRHYVGTALGLGTTEGIKTFFKLSKPPTSSPFDLQTGVEDCRTYRDVFLDHLKEYLPGNLIALGGTFHKYKVMAEKIAKLCERYGTDPTVQKRVDDLMEREEVKRLCQEAGIVGTDLGNLGLALDGKTDNIQTIIFHWVKNICFQIESKARREQHRHQKLPYDGAPIVLKEPPFLKHPECQKILRPEGADPFEELFQKFVTANLIDHDR